MEMTLTEQEMVEILEDLARNASSAVARIQAIKLLLKMAQEDVGRATPSEFAALYDLGGTRGTKRRRSTRHGLN